MTDHQPPPAVEALDRLEELARAALDPLPLKRRRSWYTKQRGFNDAANPQAILSLIESLRHSVEREAGLREALEKISEGGPVTPLPLRQTYQCGFDNGCEWAGNVARAALDRRAGDA